MKQSVLTYAPKSFQVGLNTILLAAKRAKKNHKVIKEGSLKQKCDSKKKNTDLALRAFQRPSFRLVNLHCLTVAVARLDSS